MSAAGNNAVSVKTGGFSVTPLDTRFDLIIMTGHVFQVFLDDADVRATLRTLRRHLAPARVLRASRHRTIAVAG